ncbi:hypothetical protein [Solidesulfovibrio sp.]
MTNAHLSPPRSRLRMLTLALPVSLLLAYAFVTANDHAWAAELRKPAGSVTMEFGQGGFILSASGGKGTLNFKGRKYPFKVGGMGVGALGVSKITAVGEVYGLKRVEDFPGGYLQTRTGYAAVEGQGVQWLENSNGVVMKLRSTSKGLSLDLGADGLKIEMGSIKTSKPKG